MSGLNYLLPRNTNEIPTPHLIVVEGMGDVWFIDRLLELIGISSCTITCPSREGLGGGNGIDAIPNLLRGIKLLEWETPRGILVIVDADVKPEGTFAKIQKALSEAKRPVPEEPSLIKVQDDFRVAVFLIPRKGETGTLEKLLMDAVLDKYPETGKCLEDFFKCVCMAKKEEIKCTENQLSKMQLSALVAASCKKNPWASDALMWSDKGNPVDIKSDRFNHISAFLKEFTS